MTTYAYLRTSTADQQYGIDAQRSAILARFPDVVENVEHASGKNVSARPVFRTLLDTVQPGDTLVVAKLDRFARSVVDAVTVATDLRTRGVNLVILDMQLDMSTPVGELVFNVLASVAQFERSMISQRTRDGLAAAKAGGAKLGRKSSVSADTCNAICQWYENGYTVREIAAAFNLSKSTVFRCLNQES